MTGRWKDQTDLVSLTLKIEGELRFMVLLTRAGLVKRVGFSDPASPEGTLAVGHHEDVFASFMETVPEQLAAHQGSHRAQGENGPKCHWRIEFGGPGEVVALDVVYHAHSAGPPKAIMTLADTAERLTDEWYAEQLKRSADPEPSPAASPGAVEPAPNSDPAASAKRRVLAIVLDFFLLSVPYAYLLFLLGPAYRTPSGGSLVLFGIVEFILLYFFGSSPGYWALGIASRPGRRPNVDQAQQLRESWVTMVVALLLLRSGIDAMSEWTMVRHIPAPYFGLELSLGASLLVTVGLGLAATVAGLLILRTDVRGVWVGAAFVGVSLLAIMLSDSELMDAWIRAEMVERRAAQGRPIRGEDLESLRSISRPLLLGIPLAYAAGLGLSFRRLSRPVEE